MLRGESDVKMETEIGVMYLHAKECQSLLTTTRGMEQILPQNFQKEPNLPDNLI